MSRVYYVSSGIMNCCASVGLLLGDVYNACRYQRVKLSKSYIVSKSISLVLQTNYAIAIHALYDFQASVFLYISIFSQGLCLMILACTENKYEVVDDMEIK